MVGACSNPNIRALVLPMSVWTQLKHGVSSDSSTLMRNSLPRIDDEGGELFFLRVHPLGEPVHCNLGRRVRSVGDGYLVPEAALIVL